MSFARYHGILRSEDVLTRKVAALGTVSTVQPHHTGLTSFNNHNYALQQHWARVRRIKCDMTDCVSEISVRRVCKSQSLKVFSSFGSAEDYRCTTNSTDDGGGVCTSEKQTLPQTGVVNAS